MKNKFEIMKQTIVELIHYGEISESGYAEINVDICFNNDTNISEKLKAFIDTGANTSAINRRSIPSEISLLNLNTMSISSPNGDYQCEKLESVKIRIPFLKGDVFIPLDYIGIVDLNMKYDIVIGTDILNQCEFIYSGLSKTYVLKLYNTNTIISFSIKKQ